MKLRPNLSVNSDSVYKISSVCLPITMASKTGKGPLGKITADAKPFIVTQDGHSDVTNKPSKISARSKRFLLYFTSHKLQINLTFSACFRRLELEKEHLP